MSNLPHSVFPQATKQFHHPRLRVSLVFSLFSPRPPTLHTDSTMRYITVHRNPQQGGARVTQVKTGLGIRRVLLARCHAALAWAHQFTDAFSNWPRCSAYTLGKKHRPRWRSALERCRTFTMARTPLHGHISLRFPQGAAEVSCAHVGAGNFFCSPEMVENATCNTLLDDTPRTATTVTRKQREGRPLFFSCSVNLLQMLVLASTKMRKYTRHKMHVPCPCRPLAKAVNRLFCTVFVKKIATLHSRTTPTGSSAATHH